MNLLMFFDGQKSSLTPSMEEVCNNSAIKSFDVKNVTVVYLIHSTKFNFANDPYVCPFLREFLLQGNAKVLEVRD